MIHVTCRLTAKNRDQLRNPTLGNRVWATFTFYPGRAWPSSSACTWRCSLHYIFARKLPCFSSLVEFIPCGVNGTRAARARAWAEPARRHRVSRRPGESQTDTGDIIPLLVAAPTSHAHPSARDVRSTGSRWRHVATETLYSGRQGAAGCVDRATGRHAPPVTTGHSPPDNCFLSRKAGHHHRRHLYPLWLGQTSWVIHGLGFVAFRWKLHALGWVGLGWAKLGW